jgi:sugar phosphate isomerase/epimerase
MKISISNIAWSADYDLEMYAFLSDHNINGLEIAPTRIFPENPYDYIDGARKFSQTLLNDYKLSISSMQSIWYGRNENIFGSEEERQSLIEYTKKAIDFAEVLNCPNLVFGCPKNRILPSYTDLPIAYSFFTEIGDYAQLHNTTVSLEPNPPYYNTNFINTTVEAFDFCRKINCVGLKVNIDLGTCIYYNESLEFLNDNINLVNHIHISEPMLAPLERRALHRELIELDYDQYFSIEIGNTNNLEIVKSTVCYIKEALS